MRTVTGLSHQPFVTAAAAAATALEPDALWRDTGRLGSWSAMDPDRLASMPLFASLSSEDRARVADSMEAVTVEAGENLCLQGEFAYRFFVIEAGTADVTTDGVRVAALGAGDCFGEIGLLVTGRRSASVVATSPMRLFVIFEQPFAPLHETSRASPSGSAK